MRTLFSLIVVMLLIAGSIAAEQGAVANYKSPTRLHGMTVIGQVEHYANDTIEFARIAYDDSLFGHRFPAGTGFHFTQTGVMDWCFLGKDWTIQGYRFHGGGHEWMTCFYPSGKLLSGGLSSEQTIDGIPCSEGTFWTEITGGGRTYFHEDGKLKYTRIAKTIEYRGQTLKKGKHVKFKTNGDIESIK